MEKSEQHWVEKILQQEPQALAELIERYGASVYRLAKRLLDEWGTKEDIEECASDVFLSAWTRIGEYDVSRGSLATWLLVLTKYKALDYRRKLAARPRHAEWEDGQFSADPLQTEELVLDREDRKALMEEVKRLSETDRNIFYHRFLVQDPIALIAGMFGLTPKAVESRLGRMKKKLMQRLAADREAKEQ